MYKKLLVAYDGSLSSKNALVQAIHLAQTERAWIKVLAVVPKYEGDLDMTGAKDMDSILRGPAQRLVLEARDIASEYRANILTDVEQGEAFEEIVEVASDENCDLIIMGRRGRGSVDRALMGSVTARVVGHSNKDVLVIPREACIAWDRLLVATDGSAYSTKAMERAVCLAKAYGSTVSAISVVDVHDEMHADAPALVDKLVAKAMDALKSAMVIGQRAGIDVNTQAVEGPPSRKIIQYAEEIKANMLIMGSHGRGGLERLLMGSVAERVIGFSAVPVFVSK